MTVPLPPVSIVIPAFNVVATLKATIVAALDQAFVREIVAIDDGSTDATLAIANSFEPAVRVLSGPNRGVSAARNRGISETTAEWLLFLDADDLLAPGTIAARLETAQATGADVIITDWEELIDDGNGVARPGARRSVDWRALADDAELATATHVWAPPAAILYRRSLVEKIGGFRLDLPVIQDARFLFDAAYHGGRFAHAPHVGAQYRVAPGSLSRRDPASFWQDVLSNGKQIEALWRARGTLSAARREAVHGMYNVAARGLFAAAHPSYFAAIEAQRRLGLPLPRHGRLAAPLARFIGLGSARAMLRLVGRA
jgi:glycosyltransferase involved in cell wall biosynthesis